MAIREQSHQSAQQAPVFLLAGGPSSHHRGATLLKQVFTISGTPYPAIAYVGVASHDNREFFTRMADHLHDAGARKVTLAPLAGSRPPITRAKTILEEADLIFISGGDVEAGMSLLAERRIQPWLRQLFDHGKPFFGLSAGSIMLASQWVRWTNPDDDTSAEAFPCMGFAPILCDTHAEEDDWIELQALLHLMPPSTSGYGIPSGGGLRVDPDGTVSAMGEPISRYLNRSGKIIHTGDLQPP